MCSSLGPADMKANCILWVEGWGWHSCCLLGWYIIVSLEDDCTEVHFFSQSVQGPSLFGVTNASCKGFLHVPYNAAELAYLLHLNGVWV